MLKIKRISALALAAAMLLMLLPAVSAYALTVPYEPSEPYAQSGYYTALTNVELTGDMRRDIVAVAMSQLGYHEGDSFSDLGGDNLHGGSNYTEYCYWYGMEVMDKGEGHYGPWCAMFVSWCAEMAGIPASIINRACYAHAGGSSIYYFYNVPVQSGSYVPQEGDLIFYDWPDQAGEWNHVGIVRYVEGSLIYTIEGNTSEEAVVLRCRSLGSTSIIGFGVPNYEGGSSEPVVTPEPVDPMDPNSYPVPTRTLSFGCIGPDVCWLQAALTMLGYTLDIDGEFGPATEEKVTEFQGDHALEPNGVCDAVTRQVIISCLNGGSTPTPTPTATAAPTPTPTPTAAPTPTPTSAPTPNPLDPATYTVPERELSRGCHGDDVYWLQAALNRLGYYLVIDGIFGSNTEAAVMSFQGDHGIAVTGVCDFITRDTILACLYPAEATPTPTPTPAPTATPNPLDPATYTVPERVLSRGCTGDDVYWLQAALNRLGYYLVIDGRFGSNTEAAVRSFQADHGLAATGVCDFVTRDTILACLYPTEPAQPSPSPDPLDPNSYPVPTRTLKLGCRGDDVRWLQAGLNRMGHYLVIDGIFGNNTKAAVMGFQSERGLVVDGICGPATRSELIRCIADPAAPHVTLGDLDVNGAVDVQDALMLLRGVMGLRQFTERELIAADIDTNGEVNAHDALYLLRVVIGIESL